MRIPLQRARDGALHLMRILFQGAKDSASRLSLNIHGGSRRPGAID
jgi:hypothetical protein